MRKQQDYYDRYWSGEAGWKPTGEFGLDLQRWMARVLAPGHTVLDIGCGDGLRYGRALIDAGIDLHGVDLSELAVDAARANGIEAQVADLSSPLPFETGSFNSVICLEVMEHLLEPEYSAREIYRVLKPGGSLLITVPNVAQWRQRVEMLLLGHFDPGGSPLTARRYPWRDPHIRFFNSRSLAGMLKVAGFTLIRQGGIQTQFLDSAPILRDIARQSFMKPVARTIENIGRQFPGLLAGQLIAIGKKAE